MELYNRELLIAEKLKLGSDDPAWFTSHYLKQTLPLEIPDFHVEIYDLAKDSSLKRVAIIAPTGFGKSSCVSLAFPLWASSYAHYAEILIISATAEFANYRLRLIKTEIESNDLLRDDFGIQQGDIWRDNEINLNNEVRILARGRGSQVTGMRPELIIVDDIETEDQAKSELERASLREWFYKTLMNRPAPGGRIFMIGSISSKLAFLNEFLTEESKQVWETRVYRTTQCHSIWDAKWSDSDLAKKKVELAPFPGIYEALYESDVTQIQKYTFQKDWLRFYDELPKEKFPLFVTVDPAIGEGIHNDYTAIIVGGMDTNGILWIADVIKQRFNVEALELFGALFQIYDRYKPVKIGIESVAFQKFLKVFFESECRRIGKYPLIVELKHDTPTTKQARISSLAPLFQSGRVMLKRDFYGLLSEYDAYPEVEHDDCIAEGSMILTDKGQVKIEEIRVGDKVMTRGGFKTVEKVWNKGVLPVITKYGITGTPDHKVITKAGEIKLADLNESSILYIWNEMSLSIEEKSISETLNLKEGNIDYITGNMTNGKLRQLRYIGRYGLTILERLKKVFIFTIKTVIHSTINWIILNVFQDQHILATMPENQKDMNNIRSSRLSEENMPNYGIGAQKVVRGIGNTGKIRLARVYDLMVKDHHEFFANNILVHNCLDALSMLKDLVVPGRMTANRGHIPRYQARNRSINF